MTAPLRTDETDLLGLAVPARLQSAPPLEPPYDDDTTPVPPARGPVLRLVPGPDSMEELLFDAPEPELRRTRRPSLADPFERQPTPRAELPDPGRHAAHVIQAVLEVLVRRRPLLQLMPWTSEEVYEELTAWLYRCDSSRPSRRVEPAALRSIKVSEPADGVAEVTAVVRHGQRSRAVALRLEGIDGRWHCTLFRVL